MRTLELAQEQSKMLLENVQIKHKQDVELMENTYKSVNYTCKPTCAPYHKLSVDVVYLDMFFLLLRTKMKWLEESAAQRETLARQECEGLKERLSEQQAEYQRKLDQAKRDRDQEVEQLRDVHRYGKIYTPTEARLLLLN